VKVAPSVLKRMRCCEKPTETLLHVCAMCSYPFEIHDDALVLRKMLEHDSMQKLAATGAAGPMAAGEQDACKMLL